MWKFFAAAGRPRGTLAYPELPGGRNNIQDHATLSSRHFLCFGFAQQLQEVAARQLAGVIARQSFHHT